VVSLASMQAQECDLHIMVVDETFLRDHIFHQFVLHAATYGSINNQILVSNAVVTSKTKGNWVWFRCQLEQGFSGSSVLIANYSKGIESQQFQGDIRNSGCFFAKCWKHLSENAKKAMLGKMERES
jgi:hypothetical protein